MILREEIREDLKRKNPNNKGGVAAVPPAELEALLVNHPLIADAAVVPQKDEGAGEVPVAFVIRSNGSELTEEAVKEFIAKQVVFYKKLHKVYFVQSIPKSPSGKILRKDLRAKLSLVDDNGGARDGCGRPWRDVVVVVKGEEEEEDYEGDYSIF
ncbi:hypothetical protein Drorol1_Dr00011013 [Drosera rotundifolia]